MERGEWLTVGEAAASSSKEGADSCKANNIHKVSLQMRAA